MTAALLQTKLTVPRIRSSPVVRDRLLQQLHAVRHQKLVLVSAPAGFGKTTLLAAFAAEFADDNDVMLSWLSIGADENDPVRFLAYLTAALAVFGLDLPLDETAVATSSPDLLLTDVVNRLTAWLDERPDTHLILVLDDYHLIHNNRIHQALTFLLQHMPAQMHLVLAARADPPLPLARWRARGQLMELRQQDLRFTAEEAADFLNRVMGLQLSADDVRVLNRRTEGWIAGLQMAAVSLQGRPTPSDFVQHFGGSHRYVLDYLMDEVLSRQPQAITHFLLQTAVLDRLCAPLCDALLAANHSQQILEQLEAANLFLISLDDERRWYRYHRLFADLLRRWLQQTQPAQIPVLHRRAADWYEANGYLEAAVAHALAAGAAGHAARLIAQTAETMLMRSELVTVKRWLEALPAAERARWPSLSLYYAWALIMEGRAEAEIEQELRHVDAEGAPGELALARSLLVILHGRGDTAVDLAQQALAQLAPDRGFLRGVATWILGMSLVFRGELEQGMQTLEEAVQLSRQAGNMAMAVASLGRLANQAWREGDLHRARRIYQQALALATDDQERPLPIAGETLIGLARLYYEWNDLDTARQYATDGIALTERWREVAAMGGYLWLARVKTVQEEFEAAREAMAHARAIARRSAGTELDDLAVAMWVAQLRVQQGDLNAALAWADERGLTDRVDPDALRRREDIIEGHLRKYEYIVLARIRLAQDRPDAALALLTPLLTDAQRLNRVDLQLEIRALTALAYWQMGAAEAADRHVQDALTQGQPGGFIRTFVEAGPAMGTLLARQQPDSDAQHAYLQEIRRACGHDSHHPPPAARQPLIEPLSEREMEVLVLIADGLSNREIAQALVISLPTVKWHTSNIYGKLDVGNRTTAVARARELNILP